ncbi:hypothetical protein [uncultured Methanobrevibacter sp.]|nr:hypothetical protein [uncultured Methanobrevibacter sp.]
MAKRNFRLHNPDSPLLIGNVDGEKIKEVKEPSYIERQQKLI